MNDSERFYQGRDPEKVAKDYQIFAQSARWVLGGLLLLVIVLT